MKDLSRQKRWTRKLDELTERLVVARFTSADWHLHDTAEGIVSSARQFAQLILEKHEGEI